MFSINLSSGSSVHSLSGKTNLIKLSLVAVHCQLEEMRLMINQGLAERGLGVPIYSCNFYFF